MWFHKTDKRNQFKINNLINSENVFYYFINKTEHLFALIIKKERENILSMKIRKKKQSGWSSHQLTIIIIMTTSNYSTGNNMIKIKEVNKYIKKRNKRKTVACKTRKKKHKLQNN